MSALAKLPTANIEYADTGLVLPEGLPETAWRSIGEDLGRDRRASAWWVGDWVNYGEDAGYVSREKYDVAEQITGMKRQTLWQYASVARNFESSRRLEDLVFGHHDSVASLPPAEQDEVLNQAAANKWTIAEIRAETRTRRAKLVAPFELISKRDRDLAKASKLRVEKAVGACNGLARGLDGIKVEQALALASADEVSGWNESIRDAIAALNRLRARLKEAS